MTAALSMCKYYTFHPPAGHLVTPAPGRCRADRRAPVRDHPRPRDHRRVERHRRPRLAPASSHAARRGPLGDPRRSIPRRGTQPLPAGSGSRSPATAPGASAPSAPGRRNHPSDRQQIAPVRADPFRFRAGRFGSPGDQLAGTRRSSARPGERPCFPELQVELSGARRVAVAAAAVGEGSGGNRRRDSPCVPRCATTSRCRRPRTPGVVGDSDEDGATLVSG